MRENKVTNVTSDREIINLWLADKSKTTQVSYGSILKQFLDFLGSKQLSDVMLENLQLWKRGLELRFKPTTVGNKVLVIKSLFSSVWLPDTYRLISVRFSNRPRLKNL